MITNDFTKILIISDFNFDKQMTILLIMENNNATQLSFKLGTTIGSGWGTMAFTCGIGRLWIFLGLHIDQCFISSAIELKV